MKCWRKATDIELLGSGKRRKSKLAQDAETTVEEAEGKHGEKI